LRMLTNVGDLIVEQQAEGRTVFNLGRMGELLVSTHPSGLADAAALQNHEAHWKAWSALPDILRTGKQNGFVHAYGKPPFEYMEDNHEYKQVFNKAMSG